MRELVEVLRAHEPDRDDCEEGGLVCSNPAHLVEAVLAHLREVAADEGVRERVACAYHDIAPNEIHTFAASFRAAVKGDVGSVLNLFLDALGGTFEDGESL